VRERESRGRRLLVVAAVLLLALNLRPVVNALGAVVPELRADLGLSASVTGVLLSLPMAAFAVLGLAAPGLAARFGPHRTVVVALTALIAGQLGRVTVPGTVALFAGSVVALAGIAVANVVLPGLIRMYFPDRIPLMTATYTATLTVGAASSAALANPIEHALHADWRTGIGIWAGVAVLALVPWLALAREARGRRAAGTGPRLPLRVLAGTRVAWILALYFGVQAMMAYVIMGWLPEILTERGMSRTDAAFQVALVMVAGLVPSALASGLLTRTRRPAVLVVVPAGCYLAGFLGLAVGPDRLITAYSVLIGVGTAAFPVALTLLGLRSRTPLATTSLSAFTQCLGYSLAALGPFAFGAIFDVTGTWTLPLLMLGVGAAVQSVLGVLAVRPRYVEDELPASAATAVEARPVAAPG
jgi:CP family cyanate transporter-like MFS transporter